LDVEGDGLEPLGFCRRGDVRTGQRQWRDVDIALAPNAQRLTAGNEHVQTGARLQERDETGRGRDEVFQVVEDNEGRRVCQRVADALDRFALAGGGQTESFRDRGHDEARVAQGGERDEPDASEELVGDGVRDVEGEPRLADTAGTRQRDEPDPRVAEKFEDDGALVLASDKRCERPRQRGPREETGQFTGADEREPGS
jgi:hypothetical protein